MLPHYELEYVTVETDGALRLQDRQNNPSGSPQPITTTSFGTTTSDTLQVPSAATRARFMAFGSAMRIGIGSLNGGGPGVTFYSSMVVAAGTEVLLKVANGDYISIAVLEDI